MIRPNHILLLLLLSPVATVTAQDQGPLVPIAPVHGKVASAALDSRWLDPDELRDLRIRLGAWDGRDLVDPVRRARAALMLWDLDDPVFDDPTVPTVLRAENALRLGRFDEAIRLAGESDDPRSTRIRTIAMHRSGMNEQARSQASMITRRLSDREYDTAADMVDAVKLLAIRGDLSGQSPRIYQQMMQELSNATAADTLCWEANLMEGRLLRAKYNLPAAIEALHEVLAMNPRCSEAWYELGLVAATIFDFDSARRAVTALRRINPDHPLADLLEAETMLIEGDPESAEPVLDRLHRRWPAMTEPVILQAVADALMYDEVAMQEHLDLLETLSPGSPDGHVALGRFLSLDRQYEQASAVLEEAIDRNPNLSEPRIELGLLHMQTGEDSRAMGILRDVAEFDPFNKRVANSLFLLESLMEFGQIETEHFHIRYRPGADEVVARMMGEPLERMHEIVSDRFQHEPDRPTIIELMPDHQFFAVRITGMPSVHTIAACTGPLIAIEVPREGPMNKHLGLFDWLKVLRHEYTHTITLSQTNNRIPHWLTEAAAVSMEFVPRAYETSLVLARSWKQGTLFDFDQINWAFVRPKLPGDRSKAYAQGHWMVEFMDERFGKSAMIRLMEHYMQGRSESEAFPEVLGIDRDEFFRQFQAWAGEQVAEWGLDPQPPLEDFTDIIRQREPELAAQMAVLRQQRLDSIAEQLVSGVGIPDVGQGDFPLAGDWPPLQRVPVFVPDEDLEGWLLEHPAHPDLLRMRVQREVGDAIPSSDEQVQLLLQYMVARPVDPFPRRALARYYMEQGEDEQAIDHLEHLDLLSEKDNSYALAIARIHRKAGDHTAALESVTRGVRMDPYDPSTRELAAAIAIEAGQFETARLHIEALMLLEPDRDQHRARHEAINAIILKQRD